MITMKNRNSSLWPGSRETSIAVAECRPSDSAGRLQLSRHAFRDFFGVVLLHAQGLFPFSECTCAAACFFPLTSDGSTFLGAHSGFQTRGKSGRHHEKAEKKSTPSGFDAWCAPKFISYGIPVLWLPETDLNRQPSD